MKISDLIKMGLRNMFRRKARTLLTVVGVIIGTISIVVMVSVGMGMNDSFDKSVMENGNMTIIYVSAYAGYQDENGEWVDKQQKLDDSVVTMLKEIEHVKAVSPVMNCWSAGLFSGKYEGYTNFVVIDMDCYKEFGYPPMEDGTYPTKEEAANTFYFGSQSLNEFYYYNGWTSQSKTIDFDKDKLEMKFMGYEVADGKREFSYAIPNKKRIQSEEYSETSYSVYIDIDLYKDLYKKYANTLKVSDRNQVISTLEKYEQIQINVDNMNNVLDVQDKIKELGYRSNSNMDYIGPMQETSNMLQLVLGAIGGIAMLVSAINIANTMVMSIYERTKEIGIMKVLGCKVSDIKKLFLFEAGMIGLIGGVIGIGLSYIASWAINTYGSDLFASIMSTSVGMAEGSKFSIIPIWLPFGAAFFGMLVGVLSGYLPARRATKISAIEAMKTEN